MMTNLVLKIPRPIRFLLILLLIVLAVFLPGVFCLRSENRPAALSGGAQKGGADQPGDCRFDGGLQSAPKAHWNA